jgi:hypothetical protein
LSESFPRDDSGITEMTLGDESRRTRERYSGRSENAYETFGPGWLGSEAIGAECNVGGEAERSRKKS